MKPFQETNYIAKDKENEQWKSSLPPEEVKEKMLAQRGVTQENGSKIQFDHTVFIATPHNLHLQTKPPSKMLSG